MGAVKKYGQYCPIAKAAEILGERWTILVLRELLVGSRQFNDIARGVPGMSRTLLSKRLRQLESTGLLERLDGGYHLTPTGEALRGVVFGLGDWGNEWLLRDPDREELNVELLMWWGHPRLDTSVLPDRRVVLAFVFDDDPRRFWVVVEHDGCSVCLSDPGFGVDATIRTDSATLHKLWYDRGTVQDAVRAGRLRFEGPTAMTRRLPQVLTVRHAAELGASPDAPRPRVFTEPA